MQYKPTWDLRSIPDDPFYRDLARRVDAMSGPSDIPDALKSIVGAVQFKRRRNNRGGRRIEPTTDPALAEKRRRTRERVARFRSAKSQNKERNAA